MVRLQSLRRQRPHLRRAEPTRPERHPQPRVEVPASGRISLAPSTGGVELGLLDSQRAFVTGGGSGIGAATCETNGRRRRQGRVVDRTSSPPSWWQARSAVSLSAVTSVTTSRCKWLSQPPRKSSEGFRSSLQTPASAPWPRSARWTLTNGAESSRSICQGSSTQCGLPPAPDRERQCIRGLHRLDKRGPAGRRRVGLLGRQGRSCCILRERRPRSTARFSGATRCLPGRSQPGSPHRCSTVFPRSWGG